jgi:hypothetical protein
MGFAEVGSMQSRTKTAGLFGAACAALFAGGCSEAPAPEIVSVESSTYETQRPRFIESLQNKADAARLVEGLSFERYKQRIRTLSSFGSRRDDTESFNQAAAWLEGQLTAAGYAVEYHEFDYQFRRRQSIFVTKLGASDPGSMYIVSAHLDGYLLSGGSETSADSGAADDDASGVALVLEAALAFAPPEVETATSIRFIFWNNEENGLAGSRAYVADRAALQGAEEPVWLGMIQHDMLLFDHGLPPGPVQIDDADLDIQFRQSSRYAARSAALADIWRQANAIYSTDYPAEVADGMRGTDSVSFSDHAPAISVRENMRSELEAGANPNWHRPSDRYETYSEEDFRLGFNALQMTVGAVAELAGTAAAGAE